LVTAAENVRIPLRALRSVDDLVAAVAPTRVPVLIEGETGTGKEACARSIHARSGRSGPFVALHCSAIPESMFQAAVFGADTGPDGHSPGLLHSADRGTLFLDEIADLPRSAQLPLLRALVDRSVRPVGGGLAVGLDLRVVSATRHDLEPLVRDSRFHFELFAHLATVSIALPPLRDRPADIPALIDDTLAALEPPPPVAAEALALLIAYGWPGNVRQLAHVVTAAAQASRGDEIRPEHLPSYIQADVPPRTIEVPSGMRFVEAQARFEAGYFGQLLTDCGGNLSQVARVAGLSRATVRAKARALGLLPLRPPRR
jgi:DNA-binding NtrC family response regulator